MIDHRSRLRAAAFAAREAQKLATSTPAVTAGGETTRAPGREGRTP